jgi:8-oxo-dGTP pyrophosphatase MutT (NUDIX family)
VSTYEQRLEALSASAVTAAWNPLLHPRARNGRFIRKGGWLRGLFKIANAFEQLNGEVVGFKPNPKNSRDPLVVVKTKHGQLSTPVSQISDAAKPKGTLAKLLGKDDPRLVEYQKMSLDGDVTFTTDWPLEGRELNDIPLAEVEFDPRTIPDVDVGEPPLPDTKMRQSAGVLVEEPDGRIWLVEPANHFGGYKATFSKGGVEEGDTVQQAALREAFEEMGLVAEITGFVGDYKGSTTMTRLYRGRRVGGAPWKHDYESAEVRLVTPETAKELLHAERDQLILADLTGDTETANEIRDRERQREELRAAEAAKRAAKAKEWAAKHPPKKPGTWTEVPSDFDDGYYSLTEKYGTRPSSKLWSGAQVEVETPDGLVRGKVTRLEGDAVEVDTGTDTVSANAAQVTAVPMTQAELNSAKAEFHLDFAKAQARFQSILQANSVSDKKRTVGELMWSEIQNQGDHMPSDFLYEVEEASTAMGKVVDDEVKRRVAVYIGDPLLTADEFEKQHDALKGALYAALAEFTAAGSKSPELQTKIESIRADRKRLDHNRRLHRDAYASATREVLAEVVAGGMGGKIDVVVYNPDPAEEAAKNPIGTIENMLQGLVAQKQLSNDEVQALRDRIQESIGPIYPSSWLAASNAHKQPVSIQLDPQRSYYDFSKGFMRLPSGYDEPYFAQAAAHEFGHRMEHVNPAIRKLEWAFFWRRQGKTKTPLLKLNEIVGGSNYSDNEVARPDEFSNPYMGREYIPDSTMGFGNYWELFSSGAERLLSPEQKQGTQGTNGLLADDADYRAWVLGTLVNAKPPPSGDEDYGEMWGSAGTDVQDITFKALLTDGRVVPAKRIERSGDAMSIVTVLDERVPSEKILQIITDPQDTRLMSPPARTRLARGARFGITKSGATLVSPTGDVLATLAPGEQVTMTGYELLNGRPQATFRSESGVEGIFRPEFRAAPDLTFLDDGLPGTGTTTRREVAGISPGGE